VDCGEEVDGEPVVAGGDAAEILQATEHALDGISAAIEIGREAVLPAPVCLWRDVGGSACRFDFLPHGVCVVPFVAMHQIGSPQLVQQRVGRCAIGHLTARQQERDGPAGQVG